MQHSRGRSLGSISVAVLTLILVLSGCSATPTTPAGQQAPNRTPVATAQATPVSTATNATIAIGTIDPTTLDQAGCPALAGGTHVTVDGLKVSTPHRSTGIDYPSELMPNNEPNAPYKVPLTVAEMSTFHPNPPVNPSLDSGYMLQICNQTSAVHSLTSLSVTIASFTPSSGPVTVWHLCQDGPYDAATKQPMGGCGGGAGDPQYDMLAATLPSDHTGASALAIPNTEFQPMSPTPPLTIGPNESILSYVAVHGLTSQGTYALSFGVSIDGIAPAPVAPSDGSFLIAPSAIVWTGTACQTPAMLALIPAARQDTFYVCPPTS